MQETRSDGYYSAVFCNKSGDTADSVGERILIALGIALGKSDKATPENELVGVAGSLMGKENRANNSLLTFLDKWMSSGATQFIDIGYLEDKPQQAILIRTWEGGGGASKIYPVAIFAERGSLCWLDQYGSLGPSAAANAAVDLAVKSAGDALQRLQQLGGLGYAKAHGASDLTIPSEAAIGAAVARTQAALQALLQQAKVAQAKG